jgi:hypothetical protein
MTPRWSWLPSLGGCATARTSTPCGATWSAPSMRHSSPLTSRCGLHPGPVPGRGRELVRARAVTCLSLVRAVGAETGKLT